MDKKHLKADTVEPMFAIDERPNKLDPFAEKLAGWVKSEAGKARNSDPALAEWRGLCVA